MTATQAAAATSPKSTIQVGKPKDEVNSKGFANLLTNSVEKSVKGLAGVDIQAKHSKRVLGEMPKGLEAFDLSSLGEVQEDGADEKKGVLKLGDILAELSHRSSAPIGSEVINIKTVLGAKNDDPSLISKDLIALVPKKDQAKVMKSLIEGAKQVLQDQLEQRIPKNRVPKTLKGLLEIAIRFNMEVSDIKLESLPESKITKQLLKALEIKESLQSKKSVSIPSLSGKISPKDLVKSDSKAEKVLSKVKESPLEQMLKSTSKDIPKELSKATSKDVPKELAKTGLGDVPKELPKTALTDIPKELPKTSLTDVPKELVKTALEDAPKELAKTALADVPKELAKTDAVKSAKLTTPKLDKTKEKVQDKQEEKLSSKGMKIPEASRDLANTQAINSNNTVMKKSATLESLLTQDKHTDTKVESETSVHNNTTVKGDSPLAKADSNLQAKMAESRQLVSQLSADVKEAMQQYKPPFTKLSMKLNPERLGEIDVVMVQRGSNVHINLTSNGAALGILQQNSADLKQALTNVGLGDASMNFSSNGENRNQSQEQQKHSTTQHYAEMEKLMDDLDELEIVVPNYV